MEFMCILLKSIQRDRWEWSRASWQPFSQSAGPIPRFPSVSEYTPKRHPRAKTEIKWEPLIFLPHVNWRTGYLLFVLNDKNPRQKGSVEKRFCFALHLDPREIHVLTCSFGFIKRWYTPYHTESRKVGRTGCEPWWSEVPSSTSW